MKYEIKHRYTGAVLFRCDLPEDAINPIKTAVELAVKSWKTLANAKLEGANLSGANLEGANFRSANLNFVDFTGANLRGADFRYADMHQVQLSGANTAGAQMTRD